MADVIASVGSNVPKALIEIRTFDCALKRRASYILAYFERRGASNGPRKRSMTASGTSADPPKTPATSPATLPDLGSKAADSDHDDTLNSDEPVLHITY